MLGKLDTIDSNIPTEKSIDGSSSDAASEKKALFRSSSADSKTKPASVVDTASRATGMAALMGSLGEAGEQLRNRGEKLEQLSEKTSKLALNANKFAELAKQLNKEKSSSWW